MAVVGLTRPSLVRLQSIQLGAAAISISSLAISYGLLLSTRGWLGFADESDNFLGGFLIAHGQTLYRDYFSHHMPLTYYLAAVPALLGASDQITFRIFASLVLLGLWTFITIRFRNLIGSALISVLVLTIGLGFPWFYGHMFLGETFAAYFILIVVLYFYAFSRLDWRTPDQIVIALAASFAVGCNLMSVYPLAALMVYYASKRAPTWRCCGFSGAARSEARFAAIVLAPFVLLALGLLASGAFDAFVHDVFVFNQEYYSKYILASDPLSMLRIILRSDYWYLRANAHPLAWQNIDGFTLLANVIAGALLIRCRRVSFAVALLFVAATSRGRGIPFHDQSYYIVSFFSVALVAAEGPRAVLATLTQRRTAARTSFLINRLVMPTAAVMVGLVAVAFFIGLLRWFPWRYSQVAPYGYLDVIQATTEPGDKVWILPLGFSAYLEANRLPATRYAFYLPWLADSPEISADIARDLERSRPPVIIVPPHVIIPFGREDMTLPLDVDKYTQPLREQLAAEYTPASNADERLQGVFLRNDRADELRQRLRAASLIHVKEGS